MTFSNDGLLTLLLPVLLLLFVVWLIRWTDRRDMKAAQEEARMLMALDRVRHSETYRKFRVPGPTDSRARIGAEGGHIPDQATEASSAQQ